MSVAEFRQIVTEMARPKCPNSREPSPTAIANHLSAISYNILHEPNPEITEFVREQYGYDSINQLREDASGLIEELKKELPPEKWNNYFEDVEYQGWLRR